jgi:hypothetical protein
MSLFFTAKTPGRKEKHMMKKGCSLRPGVFAVKTCWELRGAYTVELLRIKEWHTDNTDLTDYRG